MARMAALLAGLPVETAGVTVNRLCASGLSALNMAARAIRCGEGDVFIAGGVESMSRAPYSLPKAEAGYPFGNLTAYDTALGWRYPNPRMEQLYGLESMGETAENIAAPDRHHPRGAGPLHRWRATAARWRPSTAANSPRRSRLCPSRRRKATRSWWTRTSARAATPAWNRWPGSSRPSARTARSRRAIPLA